MKNSYKELRSKVLEHSYKEWAWAQLQLGIWYSGENSGTSFFATDKEKGLQFIKQAADQRDPEALLLMALKYVHMNLNGTN